MILSALPTESVGAVFVNRVEQMQPVSEEVWEDLMKLTFGGFLGSPASERITTKERLK